MGIIILLMSCGGLFCAFKVELSLNVTLLKYAVSLVTQAALIFVSFMSLAASLAIIFSPA